MIGEKCPTGDRCQEGCEVREEFDLGEGGSGGCEVKEDMTWERIKKRRRLAEGLRLMCVLYVLLMCERRFHYRERSFH